MYRVRFQDMNDEEGKGNIYLPTEVLLSFRDMTNFVAPEKQEGDDDTEGDDD